ncbi:glucokinase [Desulfolutivibrio sulfoxidireducens]|uniref:glucokinase n=1 Tax=Desulfolutivibrio sulfoxidireducens TaxID=2773299 RepID=UPI00159E15BE|nr:glucokinase [Desulfolutivibrio sulfoxidireducens]QLA17546.1 glucokinase [Desulfolutivibrio sulfoxidireducens]QLA21128.1 glucokinase [Desulfolutivibrio sulfoxidireducens]
MTETDTGLRHLLAADIGGTHSRFGHFLSHADGRIEPAHSLWLSTREAASFGDLLAALGGPDFPLRPADADAAVFAVPGPMSGPVGGMGTASSRACRFANIGWDMDLDRDGPRFGLDKAALVNDFAAQAQAFRTPLAAEATSVLPGRYDARKVRAVLGAGTGLGMAALIPLAGGGHQVLSSEGGHASRSFRLEERDYFRFLAEASGEPYPRGDVVLSGFGLSCLHRFLTGRDLPPAEVAAELNPESETTAWFAGFYGRAARDYALTVLAGGGVYISGGVAANNPFLVTHPRFAREFHDSPTMAGFLSGIPVSLAARQDMGLFGAALCAHLLLGRKPPS